MSKVVHLSSDVHRRAKEYCTAQNLKMSDWVTQLIDQAIQGGPSTEAKVQTLVPNTKKKKILEALASAHPAPEEGVPAYALPPFWSRRASAGK